MNGDKWEEIREEHRVISEAMEDYRQTLKTAEELIDSSFDQMERSRLLLSQYHRMRELSHAADIQIAKAGESLVIDMARTLQKN